MRIQAIEGENYQNELIDSITTGKAVFVYKVEELISDLIPELEDFRYESFSGSGNPAFFVCNDEKPTDEQLRAKLLTISEIDTALKETHEA